MPISKKSKSLQLFERTKKHDLAHMRFIYQDGVRSYALYSGAIPPQNLSDFDKEIWMDGWGFAAAQAEI
ncbi:MAG: hypothetical protein COA69_08605 [Robiginitomaculum sp.]|nr:MAG: hypothetical protein COA69_08605 [Robiginitomaculum sp.]